MRALLVLAVVSTLGGPAFGHSWYTGLQNEKGEGCCGEADCHPDLDVKDVEARPGGYFVRSLGTFVPAVRAKPAVEDDGYYHICVVSGEVRCFFYPNRGY